MRDFEKEQKQKNRIMDILQWILGFMLVAVIAFFILGELLLPTLNDSDYEKGQEFKADWVRIMPDGTRVPVTVPGEYEAEWNELVIIEAILPDNLQNTWMCIRSSQHDLHIYVGGELRKEYSDKETRLFGKNSADAYVFFRMYEEDAGEILRIESISNSNYSGYLNSVYMGDKTEIWQMYFDMYLPGMLIAVFMLFLSAFVVGFTLLLQIYYKKPMDIIYLGIGMLLASLWLIAESKLRQLILPNSAIATNVGFFVIMLLSYPFAAYMNKIQKRRYQNWHMIVIICTIINSIYATSMQILGIKDFFETMTISHIIIVMMMIVLALTIITDIKRGYIKEYPEVAAGFGGMVIAGVAEIYFVYEKASVYNGIPLCLGLLILLLTAAMNAGHSIIKSEKEKQMAIAASESKAKFLANMSHEIRTPINTVIGMNEMILRENNDETINEYAKNIQGASRMLLGLINDVLDFSKIEAGKLEVTESKYYLSSMLNDVILGAQVRAEKKALDIVLDIDENMPAVLLGDEIRIKQILNNLLSNAVKYTEKGSITFSVKGERRGEEFVLVMLVKDTGMGIKKEDMQKLFGSFQRLELNKNRYIQGTGLGLCISKQLAEQMNGDIEVESEYGKGTCFTVRLPQKVLDDTPMGDLRNAYKKVVGEKEETKAGLYAPNASVLVVDDNQMNLFVVKGLLKRTAIQLDFANSGNECLELCKNKKYDVILMDHMMPEPDGVQTLHMLREDKDSLNKDTTVIVLTANAIAGADEEYLKEGFADYLTKPIEVVKLENTLAKYL